MHASAFFHIHLDLICFQASILLSALDHLKITVAEALLDLPPISEDVDVSLEDAKVKVYSYMNSKVPFFFSVF